MALHHHMSIKFQINVSLI